MKNRWSKEPTRQEDLTKPDDISAKITAMNAAIRLTARLLDARDTLRNGLGGEKYARAVKPQVDLILTISESSGRDPIAIALEAAKDAEAGGNAHVALLLLAAGVEACEILEKDI